MLGAVINCAHELSQAVTSVAAPDASEARAQLPPIIPDRFLYFDMLGNPYRTAFPQGYCYLPSATVKDESTQKQLCAPPVRPLSGELPRSEDSDYDKREENFSKVDPV